MQAAALAAAIITPDYTTSNGAKVRQEGMDSLVGRVGFSIGKDIKDGNIYARASYLYDFDGESEVTMSHSGISDVYEQDLGGGWFEVGLGANINLSDATHLYFDVEKTSAAMLKHRGSGMPACAGHSDLAESPISNERKAKLIIVPAKLCKFCK